MNIIVVGAGIAGTSVVRALREHGYDADHIAAPGLPEASRACGAILRRSYHGRQRGETALFDRTQSLYARWGVPIRTGAWATDNGSIRQVYESDWALVHPAAPLIPPDRYAIAYPTKRGARLDDGTDLAADRVIWCTGTHTLPELGYPPRAAARHGVTWVHPDPEALTQPDRIRVHRLYPYQTIVAGATVDNGARLGTSSGRTAAEATARAEAMLTAAAELGIITGPEGWTPVHGTRFQASARHLLHVRGPHWTFYGLHHTGYALGPALGEAVAAQVLAA